MPTYRQADIMKLIFAFRNLRRRLRTCGDTHTASHLCSLLSHPLRITAALPRSLSLSRWIKCPFKGPAKKTRSTNHTHRLGGLTNGTAGWRAETYIKVVAITNHIQLAVEEEVGGSWATTEEGERLPTEKQRLLRSWVTTEEGELLLQLCWGRRS